MARIAALHRYPVKGFSPEALERVVLSPGRPLPHDRRYAVENGPSGFDPAAPAHVSKMKFAVLAPVAEVAHAATRVSDDGLLQASAPGLPDLLADLGQAAGRDAFAAWTAALIGDAARGPLKVVEAPGHHFMDSRKGDVSILNLASVRALEAKVGRPVDPLRFRANIHVEGWPAFAENDWTGRTLKLGAAEATGLSPIVRCAATGVDPATARRDMDLVKALFDHFGHMFCGLYVRVTSPGAVGVGDDAELI
jgi:uncharacterized protein